MLLVVHYEKSYPLSVLDIKLELWPNLSGQAI